MSKLNRKTEIKEKVKEIKQRQQNWMKQRAEASRESYSDTSPSNTAGTKETRTKPVDNIATGSKKLQNNPTFVKETSAEQILKQNKSNARFQNWLKAKNSTDNQHEDGSNSLHQNTSHNSVDDRRYSAEKYEDNHYPDQPYRDHRGSGDVNVLKVRSSRPSQIATPDPGFNSEDETGEITAATLLSPEDFDSRADDIIARVKGDMKTTSHSQIYNSVTFEDVRRSIPAVKSKASLPEPDTENRLSSHVCPTCEKLMLPPDSTPMLLIPCGHTLCGRCSRRTKFCATCGCGVESCTVNHSLQQIISDFHIKQAHRQPASKSALSKQQGSYREEYSNLVTRREILTEERDTVSANLGALRRRLKHEQQQVHNINKQENHLERQIHDLQSQLSTLVSHRVDYERQVDELDIKTKEEKHKLSLVQDSLHSVEQQMEKVKMLSEDY